MGSVQAVRANRSAAMRVFVWLLAAAPWVVFAVVMSGCDMTEADPSGRKLTAQQWLEREERIKDAAAAATRDAIADKDAEVAKAQAAKDAEDRKRAADAAIRRKAFDAAVARLEAETGIKLAELASLYDQEQLLAEAKAAEAAAELAAKVADIDRTTAARINHNEDTIAESAAQTTAALARIEERQARIMGGIKLAEGAASTFGGPIGAAAVGLFGSAGLGGLLFGAVKARKAAKTEEAAVRVVDAIDAAKLADPAMAESFKKNAKVIAEWMGPGGVALVNRAQNA
jgi:hypothetical protein